MRFLLLALLLIPDALFADPAQTTIEKLIADAWKPLEVRVEWTFKKSSKQDLNPSIEYRIAQQRPIRFAGNLILKLEGIDAAGRVHSIPISGKARIFGKGFTVTEYIGAGEMVEPERIAETELEWTRLNDVPVTEFNSEISFIAAHGLVPGRTICRNDLKLAPVITKDQPVTLELCDNAITISLVGRALKAGAVGEEIPVAVELEHTKRYRGIVVNETTVRFIQ
jgi:flagella basal body P-ring formation protein FlgA